MNALERLVYNQRGGTFREFEGLVTYFEPRDSSLYRHLLPAAFNMPVRPIVTVFVADYISVASWPLTRYQEWSALLRCERNGEEGWYCVTMPVTKWIPMVGGRYLGFPKYIVDSITISMHEGIRLATAKSNGAVQLLLEFHPGTTRQLVSWERDFAENESFFKGSVYLLVPPGKGPRVQRVILSHVIHPKWSPELGLIQVRVNPKEAWAGLVPEGDSIGSYNHFLGGINLVAERLT